jgi:hypothetical protein
MCTDVCSTSIHTLLSCMSALLLLQAATKSVYDALRARLEATTDRLLQGQLGEDLCEEASAAAAGS